MTKSAVLRAIRKNCIECMGGQAYEVPKCTSPKCPLFALRSGADPSPSKVKGDAVRMRFRREKPTTQGVILEKKECAA